MDLNSLHKEWYDWTMKGGKKPTFLKKRVAYYVAGEEKWKYTDSLESIPRKSKRCISTPVEVQTMCFTQGRLTKNLPKDSPPRHVHL